MGFFIDPNNTIWTIASDLIAGQVCFFVSLKQVCFRLTAQCQLLIVSRYCSLFMRDPATACRMSNSRKDGMYR